MADATALIGFCGSRSLDSQWQDLVARVVSKVAEAGRSVAVGCAMGADAMALRACFTESGEPRVPYLLVFAAFGPSGEGAWRHSAARLVQRVSQRPDADPEAGESCRILVNWWAGGGPETPLIPRLKGRTAAMVTTTAISGPGRGLVAFVAGGPRRSPGTWGTIRLAYEKGLPIVVFPCGCSLCDLASLGEGHWTAAGAGVWAKAWRWVDDDDPPFVTFQEAIFDLLGWKETRPIRPRTELDFPLMLNLRQYLWERNHPKRIED